MNATTKLRRTLAVSLAAGSIAAVALGLPRATEPPTSTPHAASGPLRCSFEPGETAAFTLASTVRDVRGEDEDQLLATLSWQVDERLAGGRWRLRAGLTEVTHRQALTAPDERTRGPLTAPFFIDVDASCRFVGFGFPRDWDARRRQLVQSTLVTHEFVLPPRPGARRWSASQSDGLGAFAADYTVASGARGPALRVERRKAAYEGATGAASMGLSVNVVGSRATASFERARPQWWTAVSGHERVQIRVQGEVEADLLQQFSLSRDDAKYAAVGAIAPSEADFRDAFELPVELDRPTDPAVAQMSYDDALAAFLGELAGTDDRSFAAARRLAAWLKAHPEAAHRLVGAVRAGVVAEAARPALFLALELSGTDAARDALSAALVDPHFRALDRARAASALSDLGAPTRGTAELLLAQAREGDDATVASVSLLGLGSMARRSGGDDELRAYIRGSLTDELEDASDAQTRVVLDAMGNSGDPALAGAIGDHVDAEQAATRQHAAQALGRLGPEAAAPRLMDRLREEADPAVRVSIVRALHGTSTSDAIALMADRLTASTSLPERSAIITWLGEASRTRPEARALLAAHARGEDDARLVQQIGGFVPASELR